jgi:hypothetical protein
MWYLEQGKDATLFISEGDALDMRTNKLTNFIQGRMISLENASNQNERKYKTKYNQKIKHFMGLFNAILAMHPK